MLYEIDDEYKELFIENGGKSLTMVPSLNDSSKWADSIINNRCIGGNMFKDDLLKDKRILVTGGGTGLGKEMATHFAKHGAQVYICGRRGNVLEDTANELKKNMVLMLNMSL